MLNWGCISHAELGGEERGVEKYKGPQVWRWGPWNIVGALLFGSEREGFGGETRGFDGQGDGASFACASEDDGGSAVVEGAAVACHQFVAA